MNEWGVVTFRCDPRMNSADFCLVIASRGPQIGFWHMIPGFVWKLKMDGVDSRGEIFSEVRGACV